MTFFNDFKNAIDNYESDFVEIEKIGFEIDGGGTNLETTEGFKFKIAVKNNGPIDMKRITVRISGSKYAKVRAGSYWYPGWSDSVVIKIPNLDAYHSTRSTRWVYGKAVVFTNGVAKDIVSANIAKWDASLAHLRLDRSRRGPREAILNIEIRED